MTTPSSHNDTRILVVDDEKLIRLAMRARLKAAGYTPVEAESVDQAMEILNTPGASFSAIISDIMMGNVDGFMFRDIVRGTDPSMPFFFLTALDPEEGSGFLKRILCDPISYYLPKSTDTKVLVRRIQRIVASRRIEHFIERQEKEQKQSLAIASRIQRSMLPPRMNISDYSFYTTWSRPKETVSGDLYEIIPFGRDCQLYVLGDIQGHGTSAALAMTAVQAFMKQLKGGARSLVGPSDIANLLQQFFRANLAEVSYMTAIICLYNPFDHWVRWISCGAPDMHVVDNGKFLDINPGHRGGVPIGLLADTTYSVSDEVATTLSPDAVCLAFTDGIFDLLHEQDDNGSGQNGGAISAASAAGDDNAEVGMQISDELLAEISGSLVSEARAENSLMAAPHRIMAACEEHGYSDYHDDVTVLAFGAHGRRKGVYEATVAVSPQQIDEGVQAMARWCAYAGWRQDMSERLQLVVEEKLMNVHDHGFDDRDRLHEVAGIRLRERNDTVELTIWDCATPEPSLEVAAGDTNTAFKLANQGLSNHGRGRLMVRALCRYIARRRFGQLNETRYYLPIDPDAVGDGFQGEPGL